MNRIKMHDAAATTPPPYHPDDKSYLRFLEGSRDYYVKSSNTWQRWMWACQCLTVISTVVAGIAAAAVTSDNLLWAKWISVGASVAAAASLTILREFRVQQMTTLRDDGRREMDDILSYALNSLMQHRDNAEERHKIREIIRLRTLDLELRQGTQWKALHQVDARSQHPRPGT